MRNDLKNNECLIGVGDAYVSVVKFQDNSVDSIGVDKDTVVSVVKLKNNLLNLIGVDKGTGVSVIQLGINSILIMGVYQNL